MMPMPINGAIRSKTRMPMTMMMTKAEMGKMMGSAPKGKHAKRRKPKRKKGY